MKVQDFLTVVQLGVGIHAGTAILQLSGELGVAPLVRRLDAMRTWLDREKLRGFELEDEAEEVAILDGTLIVFKTQYERLYRKSVGGTFGFACILLLILCIMSFVADKDIPICLALVIVLLSVLPAAVIFGRLWFISSEALAPIKTKLSAMEAKVRSLDR